MNTNTYNNINIENDIKTTHTMKGGMFSKIFKGNKFKDVVKNTKSSEGNLINAYEDMDNKTKKYAKAYTKHMENIKMLDDYVNFNGMETLFTKVIMKDNFVKGKIDRSNPLLFRNYLIEGEVLPSTFRREHLLNQIRYLMSKSFGGRDEAFIKYTNITNITKEDFLLSIVTIDNVKDSKVIHHSDFLIDKEKTKKFIGDVLSSTKKKLKRTSVIASFNNNSDNRNVSSKSSKKTKHSPKTRKSSSSMSMNNKRSKKSKSKKQDSLYKFSIIKHSQSKSKNSVKPVLKQREINNEYLSPYEKHVRNEKRKAEKTAVKPAETPDVNEKKKDANLGTHVTGEAPGKPMIDPIKVKCEAHGTNKEACDVDSPDCFFSKNKLHCYKSSPKRDVFGNPPATLGEKPQYNLFAIPQKQPESLV